MAKALFFDLDGTLVDGKHGVRRVYPEVQAELRRIQSLGHKLFVATGRPHTMLTPDLFELGFDGFVMANGGHVEVGGKTVHLEFMGLPEARAAADLLERMEVEYTIDTAHHVYIRREYGALRNFFSHHHDIFTFDFDREDALARAIKLEAFPTDAGRQAIRERAAREIGPAVFCGDNGTGMTFEMYSPRLSKVTGIKKVLESCGIAREDSYAFGDGDNDLAMIEYCGCGVAMGNATEAVKAGADVVCGAINEGGLACALRELFP